MDPHRDGHERGPASAQTLTMPQPQPAEPHNPSIQSVTRRSPPRPQTSSTIDKFEDEILAQPELPRNTTAYSIHGPLPPLPQARVAGSDGRLPRLRPVDSHISGPRSGIDWIVPVNERPYQPLPVGERLQPTLDMAMSEKDKYAAKAKMTGYALNAAIGLQVLIGSLITGLSAAIEGKKAALSTTILGAFNTLIAAYLARARGSNEPELSVTRVKDLEQFIRECQAFQMDHGHVTTGEFDEKLGAFRRHFEELLGNASGERKLSTPV